MAENKLNANHFKEINKFLNFFNHKKEESFKEIERDYKDFLEDNLTE
jgi:hypothetical protein